MLYGVVWDVPPDGDAWVPARDGVAVAAVWDACHGVWR